MSGFNIKFLFFFTFKMEIEPSFYITLNKNHHQILRCYFVSVFSIMKGDAQSQHADRRPPFKKTGHDFCKNGTEVHLFWEVFLKTKQGSSMNQRSVLEVRAGLRLCAAQVLSQTVFTPLTVIRWSNWGGAVRPQLERKSHIAVSSLKIKPQSNRD